MVDTEDILGELKEQTRWLRVLALQEIRPALEETLDKPEMRVVYELSDGRRTAREIADAASIGSHSTVTAWWSKWAGLGLMEASRRKGRKQRIVSLADLGIPVELPKDVQLHEETTEEED